MEKYKRYYGVIIFLLVIAFFLSIVFAILSPKYAKWDETKDKVTTVTQKLEEKRKIKANIAKKLKNLQESVLSSQKKIYSPVEDKLGDDTLFFTLYSDLIEMVHANTIKIKSIDYEYNPKGDIFVQQKGSNYFVCDVNIEVVSNYVNLGKLIQDIYQYPYYIKINNIEVIPYPKDKKILLSKISMRLYAHTTPDTNVNENIEALTDEKIQGAETPLPKE